jgi:hypothetical protein
MLLAIPTGLLETIKTSTPCRRASIAALIPAAPLPMIKTSVWRSFRLKFLTKSLQGSTRSSVVGGIKATFKILLKTFPAGKRYMQKCLPLNLLKPTKAKERLLRGVSGKP